MKITVDFETRSAVDLRRAGPWVYAEHWSTDALCLALKTGEDAPVLWVPEKFADRVSADRLPLVSAEEALRRIDQADIVEAHNSGFERAIWYWTLHKRLGWPLVDPDKWRCSAAKAAYHALPRQLGKAGEALDLDVAKDGDGHRLMLQMCKPRRARKQERADLEARGLVELDDGSWQAPGSDQRFFLWYEDPERFTRLCRYCLQDVEAEHALSETLRDLPETELRVWQLDQRVNARGIYCDVDGVQAMIDMVAEHRARLEAELKEITGGSVASSQAVAALRVWLSEHGVSLLNLQRGTVEAALAEQGMDPAARRALEIRLSLSRSSVAKYEAMMDRASHDRRIRDTLLYHGASTGRWSGMGIQPQNMPRGSFEDVDQAVEVVRSRDVSFVEMLWGDPMDVASTCTRSMLCAAPGCDLLCADFSSIEARGVAWLAGEQRILDAFREGLDVYKVAAQPIYGGKPYADVTKDERQIGKVVVLACGYQGRVGAFQSMARVYGLEVSDDQAAEIVDAWRADNQEIVRLWYGLEEAAFNAVQNPGAIYTFRGLRLVRHTEPSAGFLHIRLPSGRVLHYYDPRIGKQKTSWGEKNAVTYMGVDSQRGYKWTRLHTYGGKLVENVVQALCRDIMAEAQLRLEAAGYRTVLTVHDEALAEVPKGRGSLEEFERIMSEVPSWAEGFPVKAEGWRGERYRK